MKSLAKIFSLILPNYRLLVCGEKAYYYFVLLKRHRISLDDIQCLWFALMDSIKNLNRSAWCNTVGPEYLFLLRSEEEMRKVVSKLELKVGVLQALGCIYGTYTEIKRSIENAQDFYSYKQFFSFIIQAVYDSTGRFMDHVIHLISWTCAILTEQ